MQINLGKYHLCIFFSVMYVGKPKKLQNKIMNLKTINKTSYCYYFIEVGVIIKCSGLENKLAEQRLCDPQVLLCRSS